MYIPRYEHTHNEHLVLKIYFAGIMDVNHDSAGISGSAGIINHSMAIDPIQWTKFGLCNAARTANDLIVLISEYIP